MSRRQPSRTAGLLPAGVVVAGCNANIGGSTGWSFWNQGRLSRTIAAGTTSMPEERSAVVRSGQTIAVTCEAAVREGPLQIDIWRPLNVTGGAKRLASATLRETRNGTLPSQRHADTRDLLRELRMLAVSERT